MKNVVVLVWHSLRRFAGLLLATGLLLCAFQILMVQVAAYLERTRAFSQFALLFPQFVREIMGPAFFAMLSFAGVVSLGYFHVAVLSALTGVVIAAATEPAAEMESGFADLVLASPVRRHVPITRTVIVLLVAVAALLGAMVVGTYAGLALLAPTDNTVVPRAMLAGLSANLAALLLSWGGIALAAGAYCRRRGTAGAFIGVLALAGYLLVYLGQLWHPAEKISHLSPFYYYRYFRQVMGEPFPLRDISVLIGVALAGILVAYVVYARRDL